MSPESFDVAVVGAGLAGAAAAWRLAARGLSVAVFEAYAVGHPHGSSHGSSRIFRRTYTDPFYVALTGRAAEAWQELETDSGTVLRRRTGGLDTGAGAAPEELARVLAAAGVPNELLTAGEAGRRWPGMRFTGPVLHHPEAGVLDPGATVAACLRRAGEQGARLLTETRVTRAAYPATGGVRLVADTGEELSAQRVVLAAGAWLPELAGAFGIALPPLRVTQQQVFHFRRRESGADWPVFLHRGETEVFGLPSGSDAGPEPAVKVAELGDGLPTTADSRSGTPDPASRAAVTGYVTTWLPGLRPEPVAESTCLYTSTRDGDFILDRHGPVVVVSPCSGHGAKFAPLIGELTADLVTGRTKPHPRFAPHR
ncbi:FAD-dependent oxidoreductase [Streptomyces corynorhini]|uniref:FAD-dependent oxidoreductase n=1 Tax=Streptomyces corynorhini TaxID=2282652 RepID=A0A370BB71_9ACTN|nr:FAD-dependent oxidoreductase [Streptomyces corynorhini]RDG36675.1 FAD-dependent oxidoreductase [Streptomyces corynorhini]